MAASASPPQPKPRSTAATNFLTIVPRGAIIGYVLLMATACAPLEVMHQSGNQTDSLHWKIVTALGEDRRSLLSAELRANQDLPSGERDLQLQNMETTPATTLALGSAGASSPSLLSLLQTEFADFPQAGRAFKQRSGVCEQAHCRMLLPIESRKQVFGLSEYCVSYSFLKVTMAKGTNGTIGTASGVKLTGPVTLPVDGMDPRKFYQLYHEHQPSCGRGIPWWERTGPGKRQDMSLRD